ncbi:MAG: glutamate racemase [Brevinema sp.]
MPFIGVFDSGLGGLSILKALHQQFPYETFVYLADSLNIPYGDKSSQELSDIFIKNINYFNNSKGVVIACNTMSSFLEYQDFQSSPPLIGVIRSLVRSTETEYDHIQGLGILGTSFTVNNQAYLKNFEYMNPQYPIYQIAAPLLVPAIENNDPKLENICRYYLGQFPNEISHLILGCTHYNLLLEKIQSQYKNLTIIDPYKGILQAIKPLTTKNNTRTIKPIRFLTTKYTMSLQKNSEEIMQQQIEWNLISL